MQVSIGLGRVSLKNLFLDFNFYISATSYFRDLNAFLDLSALPWSCRKLWQNQEQKPFLLGSRSVSTTSPFILICQTSTVMMSGYVVLNYRPNYIANHYGFAKWILYRQSDCPDNSYSCQMELFLVSSCEQCILRR